MTSLEKQLRDCIIFILFGPFILAALVSKGIQAASRIMAIMLAAIAFQIILFSFTRLGHC